MNREIKFRAYSKITKNYLNITHVENGSNTHNSKTSILEQFTGFKDKNGTEIYEGDQLHVSPGYVSFVDYQDGMFVSIYSHPEDGEILPLIEVEPEKCTVIPKYQ